MRRHLNAVSAWFTRFIVLGVALTGISIGLATWAVVSRTNQDARDRARLCRAIMQRRTVIAALIDSSRRLFYFYAETEGQRRFLRVEFARLKRINAPIDCGKL